MVSWQDFAKAVEKSLGKHRTSDPDQITAIKQGKNKNIVIYAGPGTGKTATITLRIIKLVLVDGVLPKNIFATTFTRKAAKELRSRVIDWSGAISAELTEKVKAPDWNLIMMDTLDSLAEQLVSDYRAPTQPKQVVIPERTARQVWVNILLDGFPNTHQDDHLVSLSNDLGLGGNGQFRASLEAVSLLRERCLQDYRRPGEFFKSHKKYGNLKFLVDRYERTLEENLWHDFTHLELNLLNRLKDPEDMQELKANLQVILVDEYQDTNQLQEKIYFELAKIAIRNGGGITVVGDDDQSLYRFRGSKVELFADFQQRMLKEVKGRDPIVFTLKSNYRSTSNIVSLVNHFIELDGAYQEARAKFWQKGVLKIKPGIVKKRPQEQDEFPILLMLRESREKLATDLSKLISLIFQGQGFRFSYKSQQFLIQPDPEKGTLADVALLCASPKEKEDSLPFHLREALGGLQRPIEVFNPRGRDLARFEPVERLIGLVLLCIDPDRKAQSAIRQSLENHAILDNWRQQAISFMRSEPLTLKGEDLSKFINAWPLSFGYQANLTELIHGLVGWFPYFQDDPEGLAILEQLMRIVTESAIMCRYDMNIINHRDHRISLASRKEVVRHFCFAVIDDVGEMEEDLLLSPPKDRFSIMSIHQAKGLEFPMVIVDVGARFKMDAWRQRFARFPDNGSKSHIVEDLLDPSSRERNALERAFDDLVRLYYVAFTRTKDVLLLIGLDKNLTRNSIRNVALGWDRYGNWHWSHLALAYKNREASYSLAYKASEIPVVFV
ncbi:MAG: UvrD-helicase domain-containing protein [Candidatus Hodarchaeota archaeon]